MRKLTLVGALLVSASPALAQFNVVPYPGQGTMFVPQGAMTGSSYGNNPPAQMYFGQGFVVQPARPVFHVPRPDMPCPDTVTCVYP